MASSRRHKKTKRTRRPKQKALQPPKQPTEAAKTTPSKKSRIYKWGISAVLCFAFWLGIFSDLSIFSSRVSLDAPDPFSPNDPFSTRFRIINDGTFSISNVSMMATFSATIHGGELRNLTTDARPELVETIPGGEYVSQWFKMKFGGIANEGDHIDLTATITYTPAFTWWKRTVRQRFITQRMDDGTFHWEKYPVLSQSQDPPPK